MCQAQTVTDAPIIVITAYGDPTRGKAIDGGTTSLLTKPSWGQN